MFETFDGFGSSVIIWYVVCTLLVLFMAFLNQKFKWFDIDMKFLDKMSGATIILWVVIIAPIAEEVFSRILPAVIIGNTVTVALIGTIIWLLLHGKRAFLLIPMIPLYVNLAVSGLFVTMVLIHMFHNGWIVVLYLWGRNKKEKITNQEKVEFIIDIN